MNKSMLNKATSQDDGPTPGYMLNDIAKSTLASLDACTKLEDYLLERVKKNNHNTKRKALLLIKHVSLRGRPEFKRSLQRKTENIKACLQFRGPPDPLRGDEPYRAVRDAAKEALDAIFSTSAPQTTSNSMGGRIQGFSGGTGYQQSGSGYAPTGRTSTTMSSGGMTGFGNYDPRADSSNTSFLGKMKSAIGYTSSPTSGGPPRPAPGSLPPDYNYATNRGPTAGTYGGQRGAYPQASSFSNGGGSASPSGGGAASWGVGSGGGGGGSAGSGLGRVGGGWGKAPPPGQPAVVPAPGTEVAGSGRAGRARTDGTYEATLVEAITAPGGVRAVPPADKLKQFCFQCCTLDPQVIAPALVQRLSNSHPQVPQKTLHVMLALASAPGCEAHRDALAAQVAAIAAVQGSGARPAVRSLAGKVIAALGDSDAAAAPAPAASGAAPAPAAPSGGAPLIDLFGMDAAPEPAPAPAPAATPNLFEGLSQPSPVSAAPPAAPGSAAPASAGGDAGLSLFGGLSIGSSPAAAAPAAAVAPPSVPPQPAASAPASGGFFGTATTTAAAPAPASGGFFSVASSAPSFAGFGTPAPAAPAPAPTTFTPAPAPAPTAAPVPASSGVMQDLQSLAGGLVMPTSAGGIAAQAMARAPGKPVMRPYTHAGAAISTELANAQPGPAPGGFSFAAGTSSPASGGTRARNGSFTGSFGSGAASGGASGGFPGMGMPGSPATRPPSGSFPSPAAPAASAGFAFATTGSQPQASTGFGFGNMGASPATAGVASAAAGQPARQSADFSFVSDAMRMM